MGKKSNEKLMEEKIKNLNQVPYSEEAELAVLGSMLSSKEAVSKSIQWLTSDFFYKESHSKIFSVMICLFVVVEYIYETHGGCVRSIKFCHISSV